MANKLDALRDKDGKLPSYAVPGGYPVFYVTRKGFINCPDCANKPDSDPVDYDINWEDPHLYCHNCDKRIESAYAEEQE